MFSAQRTKQETERRSKEFQESLQFAKYLIFYVFMTIPFKRQKMLHFFKRSIR